MDIIILRFLTPVYNFINDRLVDGSAVLRPLSWHLILYVFRYFSRKWQKISDCECPDLIQNETPVRFLYGTQKNVRSYRAESILALPIRSRFGYSSTMDTRFFFLPHTIARRNGKIRYFISIPDRYAEHDTHKAVSIQIVGTVVYSMVKQF